MPAECPASENFRRCHVRGRLQMRHAYGHGQSTPLDHGRWPDRANERERAPARRGCVRVCEDAWLMPEADPKSRCQSEQRPPNARPMMTVSLTEAFLAAT